MGGALTKRGRAAAAAEARKAAAQEAPEAEAAGAVGVDDMEEEEEEHHRLPEDAPMPASPDDLYHHERAAFEALLTWKRARAKECGFNDPCIICHNQVRTAAHSHAASEAETDAAVALSLLRQLSAAALLLRLSC